MLYYDQLLQDCVDDVAEQSVLNCAADWLRSHRKGHACYEEWHKNPAVFVNYNKQPTEGCVYCELRLGMEQQGRSCQEESGSKSNCTRGSNLHLRASASVTVWQEPPIRHTRGSEGDRAKNSGAPTCTRVSPVTFSTSSQTRQEGRLVSTYNLVDVEYNSSIQRHLP